MDRPKIIILFASLLLFLIIIFGSMYAVVFDKNFYYGEAARYNVGYSIAKMHGFPMNESDADARLIYDNVLDYFRGTAQLNYFEPDEKSHMSDVKNLVNDASLIYYACAILFIVLILYYMRKQDFLSMLYHMMLYGSIACLALVLVAGIIILFYFQQFFVLFHLIFFPQGNWMFPELSLLILVFPLQLFIDASVRIVLYILVQSAIFLGLGFWIRRHVKIHNMHVHGNIPVKQKKHKK